MHSLHARLRLVLVFAAAWAFSVSWAMVAHAQLSSEEQTALLNAHNQYRSEVALGQVSGQPAAANMTPMVWNSALAQTAQAWANNCDFVHDPNFQTPTGENLCAPGGDSISDASLQTCMALWFSDHTSYTYPSTTYDHYTQLVWANTTQVGCGATACPMLTGVGPNSVMVVCDYTPAGNFNNQAPYVAGTACTQCPSGETGCVQGLCVTPVASPALPLRFLAALAAAICAAGTFALRQRRISRTTEA